MKKIIFLFLILFVLNCATYNEFYDIFDNCSYYDYNTAYKGNWYDCDIPIDLQKEVNFIISIWKIRIDRAITKEYKEECVNSMNEEVIDSINFWIYKNIDYRVVDFEYRSLNKILKDGYCDCIGNTRLAMAFIYKIIKLKVKQCTGETKNSAHMFYYINKEYYMRNTENGYCSVEKILNFDEVQFYYFAKNNISYDLIELYR